MIESGAAVSKVLAAGRSSDDREDRSSIDNLPFGETKGIELTSILRDNYTVAMNEFLTNDSSSTPSNQRRDALYVVIPITVIYVLIFFTGLIGNVSTCVVIARNRSMHTATNYYLFSLAVSDLLLLISGLPPEMYYIWSHFPYLFGEIFCIIQSFAAETSANATVLTITAFTVERYVAICHPFISHTMSKLSRAVKYVILIWLLALCLAIPQAIQFGVVFSSDSNGTTIPETATCSRKWVIIDHAFEISTMLFFVAPMTIITVLYVLIGVKLRGSRLLTGTKRNPIASGINHSDCGRGRSSSQRNVIRMLVAVVVAFFICWAPFHAQRLMAVYANNTEEPPDGLVTVYTALTYISGIFYYLSTTVNPLLYNIMSNKFREAFKSMLSEHCGGRSLQKTGPRRQTYSSLSRFGKSTVRRGGDRNSGSLSASDETQRLAPAVRREFLQQRAVTASAAPQAETNKSTRICISRIDDECPNDRTQTNGRSSSVRSTTLASVTSTNIASPTATLRSRSHNQASNNNGSEAGLHLTKIHRPPLKTVTLGLIAERLRFGTKSLFASQQQRPHSQQQQLQQQQQQQTQQQQQQHPQHHRRVMKHRPEIAGRARPKIQSHPSIDSANTISNSSLQDLDETEFTGSELANYMGELNIDLVT